MQVTKRLILLHAIAIAVAFTFVLISSSCIGGQDRATVNAPWLASDPKLVCFGGGYAYVAKVDGPLVVVDLEKPGGPDIVGWYGLEENPLRINLSGELLYACGPSGKLDIINVGSPYSPNSAGTVQIRSGVDDFYAEGGYGYAADVKLRIVDIDPPESAYLVKEVDTFSAPNKIYVAGGYAYAGGTGTFLDAFGNQSQSFIVDVVDVEPPEDAHLVRTLDMFTNWDGCFAVRDGYMYVLSGDFFIVDIDPIESAAIVGSCAVERPATGITVTDEYAYLTSGGTVQIIDLFLKEEPRFVETKLADDRDVMTVKVSGDFISVTGNPGGLRFVRPD